MDIKDRFCDLATRAEEKYYTTFSDFLNIEEQSELKSLKLSVPVATFGGYENAERVVAGFGENVENEPFPISIIKAEPLNEKFADNLTHRDFLGSLMGLGIKRQVVGDIKILNNTAFIFCLNSIANYILENLTKVRHTSVKCSVVSEIPTEIADNTEEKEITAPSLRVDAVLAGVYNISRSATKGLFAEGKVFVNCAQCENTSLTLKPCDIVSVRGHGRFEFLSVVRQTKKGKLVLNIKLYK